ncbi:MAG: PhnD/SsuA/transferrin family substrate-binding protein, partial [Betaproteobacteria bacterium]
IANARMYAVTPAVAASWRALFEWVGARAGVALDVIDHAAPQPLHALWTRDDLACAFMCGYPWATWQSPPAQPALLAALVPAPPRYFRRSAYCTDIVVRGDSDIGDVEALRGRRFAFTTPSSQSGYQAPRALFAAAARESGGALFERAIGPLVTPRAIVDAVLAGDADAGPLDGYWHDLLARHEPATAAQLRTIASTPLTAMPPLVCHAELAPALRTRIADALLAAGTVAELREVRDDLLIARFAAPAPADYAILVANAARADALGYRRLQ